MSTPLSAQEQESLRHLIRELLAEVVPSAADAGGPAPEPVADRAAQPVSLRTDEELQAFVRQLLQLFENPKRREDLRAGRLRFTLAAGSIAGQPRPSRRVERGAVTEAQVKQAAAAGAELVLARGAILTPLARDRARALGVPVRKET